MVLPVEDCERWLRAAEGSEGGKLVPCEALCLFGGLRPYEAARLTWEQVNLADKEIRLRGQQTKTGKGRMVVICPTPKAWLTRYKGQDEIYRPILLNNLQLLFRTFFDWGRGQADQSQWLPYNKAVWHWLCHAQYLPSPRRRMGPNWSRRWRTARFTPRPTPERAGRRAPAASIGNRLPRRRMGPGWSRSCLAARFTRRLALRCHSRIHPRSWGPPTR